MRIVARVALGAVAAFFAILIVGLILEPFGVTDSPAGRHVLGGSLLVLMGIAIGSGLIALGMSHFTRDGSWSFGSTIGTRILAMGVFCLLGLIAVDTIAFSLWGLTLAGARLPWLDALLPFAFAASLIALVAVLMVAAVMGAIQLGGPRYAWVGVAFVAGWLAGAAGQALDITPLLYIGIALMGIGAAGFFVAGVRGDFVPSSVVVQFSGWGSFIVGAGTAAFAIVQNIPILAVLGAMSMAASLGIWLGQRTRVRARR